MSTMRNSTVLLRRMTVSAMFLSLALMMRFLPFTLEIPLFGQNGMRVGVAGIFSMMPAILFGPVYGAIVSGLTDLLGYLLKPTGAYLPLMTLAVALGGFLRGLFWMFLRNRSAKGTRIVMGVGVALIAAFGVYSLVAFSADGINASFYERVNIADIRLDDMHWISRMVIERTMVMKDPGGSLYAYILTASAAPLGIAGFGLILLLGDVFLSRKLSFMGNRGSVLQILIALCVSGVIVSTLNTIILRESVYDSWKSIPFLVLWLPRTIEEILANTVKVYFIAVFYGIFMKQPSLRKIVVSDK